jgi:hypothetical protein
MGPFMFQLLLLATYEQKKFVSDSCDVLYVIHFKYVSLKENPVISFCSIQSR